ncbi:DUF2892 domain-containing protein [Aureivirga marina]|uniref:DUF2892 domain-containing protein n=1 Tax=Aureivirga marina TaxID=1182451 RepID=UPI0018C99B2F|nr:DUF2892 domain-containing protein [Aureivirga marina]
MYNKYIKLVIAVAVFAWAVFQFVEGNIMNGISLILLAGIFVLFYFKNEFIIMAFLQLRKQNFEGCQKWLGYIKNPQSALVTKQQGYYFYLQGLIVMQTNINQAEKLFKKALSIGLSMEHDIAMAKLNLGGIAMSKRRKREATAYLNEAKKHDKQGMLTEQIKMMKDQMKRI